MLKRIVLLLLVVTVGLAPGRALAQGSADEEQFDTLVRVNGPVHIQPGETAQGIVAISDNARIDGTVEFLVVLDGNATITGTVRESVIIFNGTVRLTEGARVEQDVLLYNANAVQDQGATVVGGIHNQWGGFRISPAFLFGLWLSITVAVLAAGLAFAAFGGRQLNAATVALTTHVGPTVLTALVIAVLFPVLAFLLMFTIIGMPLGMGLLMFVLPVLWFVGYLVFGAGIGTALFRTFGRTILVHPYLPVITGLLILQLIALVPFVGGVIAFFAGLIGAGALGYQAWLGLRGTPTERPTAQPGAPALPAL